MSSEDKFSKYRRSVDPGRPTTWPGWIAAGLLLAIAIGLWMYAIPVYFPASKKSVARAKDAPLEATRIASWKRPGELAVVYLDIGQGDAIFIQAPHGKTMLIDSGEGKTPDNRYLKAVDSANRVILPFLKQIGVKRIDVVLTTHPHSDHMGAMFEIVGNNDLEIGELWISGFVHPTAANKKLLTAAKRREIPVRAPEPEALPAKLGLGGESAAYVMCGDPNAASPNNSSIVVKLVYGNVSFLFTGDVEEDAEKTCAVRWGGELKCDVLKVAHHGSKTSSTPTFLNLAKPAVAVISVGAYNTFGHPNQPVMERLTALGAKIYRTDEQGSIFIYSDGRSYRVEPSRL